MNIPNVQLVSESLPTDIVRQVATREAVLWIGAGFDDTPDAIASIARLGKPK